MKKDTIALIAGIIVLTVGFLASPEYLAAPLFTAVISAKIAVVLQYLGGLITVISGGSKLVTAAKSSNTNTNV